MADISEAMTATANDGFWKNWSCPHSATPHPSWTIDDNFGNHVGVSNTSGGWKYQAHAGYYFPSLAIANAETIITAELFLNHQSSFNETLIPSRAKWWGDDVDNAGGAFTAADLPQDITKTTASGTINDAAAQPTTMRAHNITDIVQEIVNRAGWSSGNNMRFAAITSYTWNDPAITGHATPSGYIAFRDSKFHATETTEPVLEVTWTVASGQPGRIAGQGGGIAGHGGIAGPHGGIAG